MNTIRQITLILLIWSLFICYGYKIDNDKKKKGKVIGQGSALGPSIMFGWIPALFIVRLIIVTVFVAKTMIRLMV